MKAPPHTVVYTHGGGRLGNQIIRFAHWMAWVRAQAGGVEVVALPFWSYAKYFAAWQGHPGSIFPVRPGVADRWAYIYALLPERVRRLNEQRSWLPMAVQSVAQGYPDAQVIALDQGESIDLADPAFLERVQRRSMTFCSGWKISGWGLFERHQDELRQYFQPAPEHVRRAQKFLAPLRSRHDVVAGLFIRQSDYRTWSGGEFFFPTTKYVDWIRQLLELHPGRRVAVVVASEEKQDRTLFAGLPCHFTTGSVGAGGHWFESFVELSQCDFVMSVPSTFSATAAFVGAIPLWPLITADQRLAFDQRFHGGLAEAARHPVFSRAVK